VDSEVAGGALPFHAAVQIHSRVYTGAGRALSKEQ